MMAAGMKIYYISFAHDTDDLGKRHTKLKTSIVTATSPNDAILKLVRDWNDFDIVRAIVVERYKVGSYGFDQSMINSIQKAENDQGGSKEEN